MTDEEIIELGAKAGLCNDNGEDDDCYNVIPQMRKFAKFVAAAEREACAEVCEKQIKSYMSKRYTTDPLGGYRELFASEQCAAAIRARGNDAAPNQHI